MYLKFLTVLFFFKDTMGSRENDDSVSFILGAAVVRQFLHKHDFDFICRAHEVCKYFIN